MQLHLNFLLICMGSRVRPKIGKIDAKLKQKLDEALANESATRSRGMASPMMVRPHQPPPFRLYTCPLGFLV